MNLDKLEDHLPAGAMVYIRKWAGGNRMCIDLRNRRHTKLGDYRYETEKQIHRITVDRTLKPEIFFFVLTHEIAHMSVRDLFGREIKPHGKEWKSVFGGMLMESIRIYKSENRPFILRHAQNPRATIGADRHLYTQFFLSEEEHTLMIQNLNEKQKFKLGKKIFQKGEKRKIRYICKELKTGKLYLVNGQAVADEIIADE